MHLQFLITLVNFRDLLGFDSDLVLGSLCFYIMQKIEILNSKFRDIKTIFLKIEIKNYILKVKDTKIIFFNLKIYKIISFNLDTQNQQ